MNAEPRGDAPTERDNPTPSQAVREHRAAAPERVRVAVMTISDTRDERTDRGGAAILAGLESGGHQLMERVILPDEPDSIGRRLAEWAAREDIDAMLTTGGTGISGRDQTLQTVTDLIDTPLPGFGELFRMLSYEQIGAAAMLSRAVGGLVGRTVLLCMPGSTAAVQLAMEKLVLPELNHLVREARR